MDVRTGRGSQTRDQTTLFHLSTFQTERSVAHHVEYFVQKYLDDEEIALPECLCHPGSWQATDSTLKRCNQRCGQSEGDQQGTVQQAWANSKKLLPSLGLKWEGEQGLVKAGAIWKGQRNRRCDTDRGHDPCQMWPSRQGAREISAQTALSSQLSDPPPSPIGQTHWKPGHEGAWVTQSIEASLQGPRAG